jgi:hypothetical protein
MNMHQEFGPSPSAQMILEDILYIDMLHQHTLYLPRPLFLGLGQFPSLQLLDRLQGKQPLIQNEDIQSQDIWARQLDHYGSNFWEASSSTNPMPPRRLIRVDHINNLVPQPLAILPPPDFSRALEGVEVNSNADGPSVAQQVAINDSIIVG